MRLPADNTNIITTGGSGSSIGSTDMEQEEVQLELNGTCSVAPLPEGHRRTESEDGENSDEDNHLLQLRSFSFPTTTNDDPTHSNNSPDSVSLSADGESNVSAGEVDFDNFLNDLSPLLRISRGEDSEPGAPNTTTIGTTSIQQYQITEDLLSRNAARASSNTDPTDQYHLSSDDEQYSTNSRILSFEPDYPASGSDRSLRFRRRTPSPRTLPCNRQEYSTVAPLPPTRGNSGDSSMSSSARSTSSQIHQPNTSEIPSGSESTQFRQNFLTQAPRSAPSLIVRPGSPSIISSAPSSQSNQSSRGSKGRLKSLRHFVTKRTGNRTVSSSSEQSSNANVTTQSLGDEDLFALSINGVDPRRPVENTTSSQPGRIYQSQRPDDEEQQQAQQPSVSGQLPFVLWEESSSSSESEAEMQDRQRRRAFSEPSSRLRSFLFPRTTSPGVRRRGNRQSRSVRRHLPPSSPTVRASRPAPLSSTAAAVLFTSSQSQVSTDSGHPLQQQRINPFDQASASHAVYSSTPEDESARAIGASTIDPSSMTGSRAGDALSVSTIGNSTVQRSDHSLLRGGGSAGSQHNGNARSPSSLLQQRLGQNGGTSEDNEGNEDGTGPNEDDPHREARVRWVRINQRFQLMITFVAVLFSLTLFSILISWIVMTSAYVITYNRICDVPLRSFYFLATIQLTLDVFRSDIMRRVLMWDPATQMQEGIPARVVAYNIAYLAYALLVLRIGINSVYIDGQRPESRCHLTAPELFQSTFVFVTLVLIAWATVILGYLVPYCFVAVLLTWNGYNPGEPGREARVASGAIRGFPGAYGSNAAPPGCVDHMQELHLGEMGEDCPQECCICMEDFRMADAIVSTDCGHILHKNCCSVWLRQARTCPVCRADIPNAQEERLRNQQQEQNQQRIEGLVRQETDPDLEEQRAQHYQHQPGPPRVQLHSPPLPFRPGGREEVETIINAFRNPGPRRQPRRTTNNQNQQRANPSSRSLSGSVGSPATASEDQRNADASSIIEVAILNQQAD